MVDIVLQDGMVLVSFVNHLGITQKLEKGTEVSIGQPVDVVKEIDKEANIWLSEESIISVKAIDLETKILSLMDQGQKKLN